MPDGAPQQTTAATAAAGVFDKYARGAAAVDRRMKREHDGSDDDFEGGVGKVGKVRRKLE